MTSRARGACRVPPVGPGLRRACAAPPSVPQHGLHVSEALDRVDMLLGQVSGAGGAAGSRRLRLVVGEGRHAAGAARLPACVKRYLDSRGVAYAEPYAGLLELRL